MSPPFHLHTLRVGGRVGFETHIGYSPIHASKALRLQTAEAIYPFGDRARNF